MKVALVNNFPPYSGTGRVAYKLFERLRKMSIEGYQIKADLYCTHVMKREEFSWEVNKSVSILHKFAYKENELLSRLLIYFVDPYRIPKGYDIYHVTNHMLGKFSQIRKPSVVTVHDVLQFKYREKLGGRVSSYLYNYFMDRSIKSLKMANRLIAVSSWSAKEVSKILEINPNKIDVVPNGLDHSLFYPRDKAEARQKFGIPDDAKVILNVGSEISRKNLKTLLQSVPKIVNEVPNVILLRLGEITEWADKMISDLGIKNKVIYFDKLKDTDLPFLYSAADLLIIPSFEEGFGFPVIEAQACGIPVVSSDLSSLPEVGGSSVFYIHDITSVDSLVESTLEVLNSCPEKIESVKREGIENAAKYSWQKNALDTLSVYNKVLGI